MVIKIIFINLIFCSSIIAQNQIFDLYCTKYKNADIRINEKAFKYLYMIPDPSQMEDVNIVYKMAKDTFTFIRHEQLRDTVIFRKKRYVVKGNEDFPLDKTDGSVISLSENNKIHEIKFRDNTYIVFDSGFNAASGHAASFSILLIFSKNKKMNFVLARYFDIKHFIDYENDGSLDLIYQNYGKNWSDGYYLLNLETGKSKKIDTKK